MPVLILLRHGQSQWNLENRFTGWIDVPLSPKGEQEARSAGKKLSNFQIDKAYTSSLKRAQETLRLALLAAGKNGVSIEKDPSLNERHYGDLQGLNKTETAKKFGDEQVQLWRRSYDVAPPGGESLKDTSARTIPYFEKKILPTLRSGKNVLIAAHGNSLRAITMYLEKLTKEQVLELEIPTGVPIVYEMDGELKIVSKRILQ